MGSRILTEPRYEYICDNCGATKETDGMYPREWSALMASVTGAMRIDGTISKLLCVRCAPELLGWLAATGEGET